DDVVGEGVERPLGGRPAIAATVAPVVVVDDLRDVGKRREPRLEARVVVAGAAVQQDQRRLLPQHRTIGDELRALPGHEQADARFDLDSHVVPSDRFQSCTSPVSCPSADTGTEAPSMPSKKNGLRGLARGAISSRRGSAYRRPFCMTSTMRSDWRMSA